jgi:hypothetical protein
LNEIKKNNEIRIYPNPASGNVKFSKAIDADFYNLTGQKVLSVKNSSSANITTLPQGVYQVKVKNGSTYKLVVN